MTGMRRETHLDFTSLLDVIMILLFIVLAGIGQRANITKDELEAAKVSMEALKEDAAEKDRELRLMESREAELSAQLESLSAEYGDYRALHDGTAAEAEVYEAVLHSLKRMALVCRPVQDASSGNWEVEVTLYRENGQEGAARSDVFRIRHDFTLGPEERRRFNASQELAATAFLKENLTDLKDGVCLLTVQYPSVSENFSSLDLDILEKAAANLRDELDLKLYVERFGVL